jgi:serine protease AprX
VLLTTGGLDENGTAGHDDDAVAPWSGRGAPQGVAKPELVAPGAHLVSLRAPGSTVDVAYGSSAGVDAEHFRGSGTSFAAAVTSGAVAALLAERHGLRPDAVKALLTSTTYDVAAPSGGAGAGGLDLRAALGAKVRGQGRGNGSVDRVPGSDRDWADFLDALEAGDRGLAASSWSRLSPAARNWAASSWSGLSFDARNWALRNWAARNWAAGADGSFEEWAARNWAARNWAARNWADAEFAASSWSARNWAASSWSARNWAVDGWAARNWAARNWAGDDWAARNWSDDEWAARNWSARNWSARNWTGLFG